MKDEEEGFIPRKAVKVVVAKRDHATGELEAGVGGKCVPNWARLLIL